MPFRAPALASPLPEDFEPAPGAWVAEEKYDGHRLVVEVGGRGGPRGLFDDGRPVEAWSRDARPRTNLPARVREALARLPPGLYDGELCVPGARSYGVTELANRDALRFVAFDVLEISGRLLADPGPLETRGEMLTRELPPVPYDERRKLLRAAVVIAGGWTETAHDLLGSLSRQRVAAETAAATALHLAWARPVDSWEDAKRLALEVWQRDGEGLILKRRTSLYRIGKRTKDWLKIKQLRSAVVTLAGYLPGKLGPRSTWVMRDDEGFQTSVKWKNLELLAEVDADPDGHLGRRCVIEYQERTPDGSYRHPRFDRWAEEGE